MSGLGSRVWGLRVWHFVFIGFRVYIKLIVHLGSGSRGSKCSDIGSLGLSVCYTL